MSCSVTFRLVLDSKLVFDATESIIGAIDAAGLPRAVATEVPDGCCKGLQLYAYGLAFKRQYGDWLAENVERGNRLAMYRLVNVAHDQKTNNFYADVTADRATAMLMKLTFGGSL